MIIKEVQKNNLKVGSILKKDSLTFLILKYPNMYNRTIYLLLNLDTHMIFPNRYNDLDEIHNDFIVNKEYQIFDFDIEVEDTDNQDFTVKTCFLLLNKNFKRMISHGFNNNSYYVIDLEQFTIFDRCNTLEEVKQTYEVGPLKYQSSIKNFIIYLKQ